MLTVVTSRGAVILMVGRWPPIVEEVEKPHVTPSPPSLPITPFLI